MSRRSRQRDRRRRYSATITMGVTREPCPSGGMERWRLWQAGRSISDAVRYRHDREGD